MSFLHGLLLGASTAIILGPVFFTLLRNSLAFGRSAGISTATGILISDVIVLLICYGVSEAFLDDLMSNVAVHHLAASLLLFFGFKFIIDPKPEMSTKKTSKRRAFVQGFLINGVNPVVFAIWIGFISVGQRNYSEWELYFYLIAILCGIYLTDLLKAIYAPHLRQWLKQDYITLIYRLIGMFLLIFGIRILYLWWV